jgi:uncharacterized damage-inducible protein DinB
MLPNELQQLMNHMEWADAEMWDAVLAESRAHSDTAIRELLYHMHSVHWAYLQIWRGEALNILDAGAFPDLTAIHGWGREYYRQLEAFLSALIPEMLDGAVAFPWTEELVRRFGESRPVTFAESILQVTSHTTHHRGQVSRKLREVGGQPRLTDFVAWVWMGKPDAAWRKSS